MDKAVYGPLKRYFNEEMDKWHRQNAGKSVTIYDLPILLHNILLRGASPNNVKAGFSSTGIWPYKPDVFKEADFAPASVTDRPTPESQATLTTAGPSTPATSPSELSLTEADLSPIFSLCLLSFPAVNFDGVPGVTLTLVPVSLQEEVVTTQVRKNIFCFFCNVLTATF